ncbi:hypothetical protein [Lysobacter gummosus]
MGAWLLVEARARANPPAPFFKGGTATAEAKSKKSPPKGGLFVG